MKNFQPRVLASKLCQEFPTKISSKLHEDFPDQECLQAAIQNLYTKISCKLHASTIYYNRFLVSCIKSFQLRILANCNSEFPAQILSCKLHEEFPAKISLQLQFRIFRQRFLASCMKNFWPRFFLASCNSKFPAKISFLQAAWRISKTKASLQAAGKHFFQQGFQWGLFPDKVSKALFRSLQPSLEVCVTNKHPLLRRIVSVS